MTAALPMSTTRTALIMAGGTGGHVIPGLTIAAELVKRGFRIVWFGTPGGIENELVGRAGYPIEKITFSGVRGKGAVTWLMLPLSLLKSFWQSLAIIRRVQPNLVLGMGGYVCVPGGLMACLLGKPLVIHESNSLAGLANRLLALFAQAVLVGFPDAFNKPVRNALPKMLPKPKSVVWSGNPIRADIAGIAEPHTRYAQHAGPLRVLIVGGSLGAESMNVLVHDALSLIPLASRPQVVHQSGAKLFDDLRNRYSQSGVWAEVVPFIDDMAARYSWCDVIICRAGALTVSEIAAGGIAAIFIPLPFAVEDEQTHNARFLADNGAAKILQQKQTTPQQLAEMLSGLTREALLAMAVKARTFGKPDATSKCVEACMEVTR